MKLFQVTKDVPTTMTREAVKVLLFFIDREGRGGILMKGTVTHQVFPLLFELNILTDDVGNIDLVAQLVNRFPWDLRHPPFPLS